MAQEFYVFVSSAVSKPAPITGKLTQIVTTADAATTTAVQIDGTTVFQVHAPTTNDAYFVIPVSIPVRLGQILKTTSNEAALTIV